MTSATATQSTVVDNTVTGGRLLREAVRIVSRPVTSTWQWTVPRACDITPSWIGGDGEFTEGVGANGQRALRRRFTDEITMYASPVESITTVMQAAGEAGIAPRVIESAGDEVVCELLPETWRPAKLDELRDTRLLLHALDARRCVHGLDLGSRALTCARSVAQRSLVRDVFIMRERCLEQGIFLPRNVDGILDELGPFLDAAGSLAHDPVLCHGDGAASNLLIDSTDPDTPPLLTGWTVCGLRDPYEEAGSVLSELHPFCAVDDAQVLRRLGLDTQKLFLAQGFAMLDGVLWALIGLWRSEINSDKSIDCTKYGMWRLVKARYQLDTFPELNEWLEAQR